MKTVSSTQVSEEGLCRIMEFFQKMEGAGAAAVKVRMDSNYKDIDFDWSSEKNILTIRGAQ